MPRVLSGVQPSGQLHLGNYAGAIKQFVDLQQANEMFVFVASYHALTSLRDAAALRANVRQVVVDYLAFGLDPARTSIYLQQDVPEVTELAWLLSCVCPMSWMEKAVSYKDKVAKGLSANVGLFTYPILQAADILLYDADRVPVGEDQRQHLELTRDLAQRFNSRFGATLTVPEPHIVRETAKILDLQRPEKQMSKSLGGSGCLFLLDDPKVSAKKIRSAVTDTGREIVFDPAAKPGVSNLLTILSALSGARVDELVERFAGAGYGDLKKEVEAAYLAFAEPFRDRVQELLTDPDHLDGVLAEGARAARTQAASRLARVYDRIGFLPAAPSAERTPDQPR